MSTSYNKRKKAKKHIETNNFINKSKNNRNKILILGGIAILAIAIILSVFIFNNAKIAKYTKTITKDQAREQILGFNPNISNPSELSNALRVADSFAVDDLEKDGKKIGEEVIIFLDNPDTAKSKKISNQAFLLLIVDNDLKVIGLVPLKPTYFDIGGKVNFNEFFNAFKDKSAVALINRFDRIYTDDSNTALVIKNKVREAMSLLYIRTYGANQFDKISKGGFIFAERGTTVPDTEFTDSNGTKYKLSEFKNKKIILIGGNPKCGGCVSSIEKLSYQFKKYGTSDIQFIVFSFNANIDDAKNLTKLLPENVIVVVDPDRTIAKKLKVGVSPYIALINKNLSLFYRGPGEPTRDTLSNIKEFLGGK